MFFLYEFGEILKSIFFTDHLRTSASVFFRAPSSKSASNAIAKSRQINWRIERIKTCGPIYFFAKRRSYMDFVSG